MCTEVWSVSVITCNQVTGKVWDSYDSTVLCLICCRRMCILLGWNPWCPWAAIEKCIPGVVTGMICFRAFLPAGSYRTLHRRVSFLHIIDQFCIHIVGTGWLRIKAETIMEFLEHIINDCLLVFHGKHPDTEIFCLIFLTELFARQSQKGKCDFVSIDFMIMFCDLNRFIVKQRSICHLNGNFQAILMCQSLLCLENIERLCK